MKLNIKALAGVGGLAFAATGWGLYGSSGTSQPTTLTKEEKSPSYVLEGDVVDKAMTRYNDKINRFVWEINTRDAIIDNKNLINEKLREELKQKQYECFRDFNDNLKFRTRIEDLEQENAEWEKYADDIEKELDEMEERIKDLEEINTNLKQENDAWRKANEQETE